MDIQPKELLAMMEADPAVGAQLEAIYSDPQRLQMMIDTRPETRALYDNDPMLREAMSNMDFVREMMKPETMKAVLKRVEESERDKSAETQGGSSKKKSKKALRPRPAELDAATSIAAKMNFVQERVKKIKEVKPGDSISQFLCEYEKCRAPYAPGGRKLLLCGKCKLARYCSREHQKADWKRHKKLCRELSEELLADHPLAKDMMKLIQLTTGAINACNLGNFSNCRKKVTRSLSLIPKVLNQHQDSYTRAIIFMNKFKLYRIFSLCQSERAILAAVDSSQGDQQQLNRESEQHMREALRILAAEYLKEPLGDQEAADIWRFIASCELAVFILRTHPDRHSEARRLLADAESLMKSKGLSKEKLRSGYATYVSLKSSIDHLDGKPTNTIEYAQKLVDEAKADEHPNNLTIVGSLLSLTSAAALANDHDKLVEALREIVEISKDDPVCLRRHPNILPESITCRLCNRKRCEVVKLMQMMRRISSG